MRRRGWRDPGPDPWAEYLEQLLQPHFPDDPRLGYPFTRAFDESLEVLVKEFQSQEKLSVDGVVGGQTWSALRGEPSSPTLAARSGCKRRHLPVRLQRHARMSGREVETVAAQRSKRRSFTVAGNMQLGQRSRARTGVALVAALAVAAAAGLVALTGAIDVTPDAARVERWFTDSGVLGPLVFIVTMWAIQPFGVPGLVWMVPAGAVWPVPIAIALCWIGNMGSSSLAFTYARKLGRGWVETRLPPSIRRFERRLTGGVTPVVALRVVAGQLPPADWLLGVTSLRWRTFLIGTGIGILPGIAVIVVAGGGLFEWVGDQPASLKVGAAVALVAIAVARRIVLKRRAATLAVGAQDPQPASS